MYILDYDVLVFMIISIKNRFLKNKYIVTNNLFPNRKLATNDFIIS